jgi:hypothetical protein
MNLVHYSERGEWWAMGDMFVKEDINQLMHLIKYNL